MKPMKGFSLMEIMIVTLIVGVMAAIAYPSYQQYVMRGYRTEGMALLNDAAARQERFFSQNNSYITDQDDIAGLGLPHTTGTTVTSETGKYSLLVSSVANDGGYTLTATAAPGSPQVGDARCGDLTLDATGRRGASGNASVDECWR